MLRMDVWREGSRVTHEGDWVVGHDTVNVRVLGPLEVSDATGASLATGAPQERSVLTLLALRAPSVVPLEMLVDLLWGDDSPKSATQVVQTLIHRLRKTVGAETIERVGAGYRLAGVEVDAATCARLAVRGREALTSGDLDAAVDALCRAAEMWRGDPVPGLPDTPVGMGERRHLRALRDAIADDLADARLARGEAHNLIPDFEAAVAEQPYSERRWGRLMLALYRDGRQADALAAYGRARSRLVDDLGVEPSTELRDLERRILEQDATLAVKPAVGGPDRKQPGFDVAAVSDLAWAVATSATFAGRAQPFRRLHEQWGTSAAAGGRRLVLISGEAGIGKTRLASEFARAVSADGGMVWHGRCDPDTTAPFQPWSEAMDHYAAAVPEGVLREQSGGAGQYLARVSPIMGERLGGGGLHVNADPDSEQLRVGNAVSQLLDRVAGAAPLLFVIDDLHWATLPTLRLLYHVLRDTSTSGILIVATTRPGDVTDDESRHRMLAELRRTERVADVPLVGLDPVEVQEIVTLVAGQQLTGEIGAAADRLHSLTGGNPYFLLEVLSYLVESKSIVNDESGWRLSSAFDFRVVPVGVREVIGLRLAQLASTDVDVLRVAAVVGPTFDLGVVSEIVGADVESALEAAAGAGLVRESGGFGMYAFAHDLLRQYLLTSLSNRRTTKLHWQIAELLASHPTATLDDVAFHAWEGAPAGDAIAAAERMQSAAAEALSRSAPDTARVHAEHGLAVLEGSDGPPNLVADLHTDRLIALIDADLELDDPVVVAACVAAECASLASADPDRIVRAHIIDERVSSAALLSIFDDRRAGALEHAICSLDAGAHDQRAVLTAYLAEVMGYHPDSAARLRWVETAHTMLPDVTSRDARDQVLIHIGQATFQDIAQHDWTRRTATQLDTTGNTAAAAYALVQLAVCDLAVGDFDGAARRAALLGEAAEVFSSRITRYMAAILAAGVASARGDTATINELRDQILPIAPSARTRRVHGTFDFMSRAGRWQWTHEDTEGTVASFQRYADTSPQGWLIATTAAAWFAAVDGDADWAQHQWKTIRQTATTAAAHDVSRTNTGVVRYELIRRWGTRDEATEARDQLSPFAGLWAGNPGLNLGPVDYWLSLYSTLLGDKARARREIDSARHQAETRVLDCWVDRIDGVDHDQ